MSSEQVHPARVVEITTPGYYVHLKRGFLETKGTDLTTGRVPIDDVSCLILSSPGITLTVNLISALSERNVPVVISGSDYVPSAMFVPLTGSGYLSERMRAHASAKKPTIKRLWASIIRRKIEAQAALIDMYGGFGSPLWRMAKRVRSGDPDNFEAQAARYYWPQLMGNGFRRDRALDGANSLLNYGYTVLRASTVRAICATGLHPMLGLHHLTRGDGLRLADDLMEPFRPAIDMCVKGLLQKEEHSLHAKTKLKLVETLYADYYCEDTVSPMSTCIARMSQSIGDVFMGERKNPVFPDSRLPISTDSLWKER